jgi:hypothetical protein
VRPKTLKERLAAHPKPPRRPNQCICRLNDREKATLIRYSLEHDQSESKTLRDALTELFRNTYPDYNH